jgi:signal recognition particle receptor subunit alpha
MLDHVCVMNYGGVVLWETTQKPLRRAIVNELVSDVLLEDRQAEKEFISGDYKVHWALANNAKFVVVAVFQRFLQLLCIDQLLCAIRDQFESQFASTIALASGQFPFDDEYAILLREFLKQEQKQNAAAVRAPASKGHAATAAAPAAAAGEEGTEGEAGLAASTSGGKKRPLPKNSKPAAASTGGVKPAGKPSKPGKPGRMGEEEEVDHVLQQQLADAELVKKQGEPKLTAEEEAAMVARFSKTFIKRDAAGKAMKVEASDWSHEGAPQRGRLSTWLRGFVGIGRELDEEDFKAIIPKLREKLISKNVAVEVAETVCKSVEASLKGTKLSQFESLNKAVEKSMVEALRRILRPKHEVDLLRGAALAKARKRPYTIVVCGVNGVGKSTSLSKLAYWLKQNDLSVLFAAGDTFRSGAVEQLAVHARCLDVPLFALGYNIDPTEVAAQSIQFAVKHSLDVVLIDTAGRMQDHESRMRSLAKTIHDNKPDVVLFVGEALVGNSGVDQLRKFNACLHDYTPVGSAPRGIDGIILTKFDTIDDKVGAALSMVYELGQPIVFVGVGQTYQDLKTIEADVVVDALMQ